MISSGTSTTTPPLQVAAATAPSIPAGNQAASQTTVLSPLEPEVERDQAMQQVEPAERRSPEEIRMPAISGEPSSSAAHS